MASVPVVTIAGSSIQGSSSTAENKDLYGETKFQIEATYEGTMSS